VQSFNKATSAAWAKWQLVVNVAVNTIMNLYPSFGNCLFAHQVGTALSECLVAANRGGFTLRQGLPDSLVAPPPDSKASGPFWRDFWGPKMLHKIQIFRGCAPDPAGGAYSAPHSLSDREEARCTPPIIPSPLSALRASFLRVSGPNPLQSWQPY